MYVKLQGCGYYVVKIINLDKLKISSTYQQGITLVELMIVVALVAIIASIAYPSYISHTDKARNTEAQIRLLEVMQQQRVFFTNNSRFTDDLIDDLDNIEADGEAGAVASENGSYLISAAPCEGEDEISDCVLLTATPTFVSAGAPALTYNSRNQKGPLGHW
ncbi:MAG: type IV pilin protein [Gammaproteobacteria bacterium]